MRGGATVRLYRLARALTALGAAMMVMGPVAASGAEVRIIGSVAMRGIVTELTPAFEKATGHKVVPVWAGTEAITRRIREGEVVARGEAELGFQQMSELLHLKGIDYLGPLPPDIQHFTVFSAGLHATSAAPEAARALIRFLTGPEAAPVIRKHGMDPS